MASRSIIFLMLLHYCFCASVSDSAPANSNVAPESCVTPRKKLGHCVLVKKCTFCINLLQQATLTPEIINYLKESQCGFEGKEPKVCCPVDELKGLIWDSLPNKTVSHLLPGTHICGLHEYNIVLGHALATVKEFPWVALLEYEKPNGRGFHCAGALINNKYVLTAAHCVERIPENWKLISVRLGEYNLRTNKDCYSYPYNPNTRHCADPPIDRAISEQIVHPYYDFSSHSQTNDIALLRLSHEVTFTEFVSPVCLPTSSDLLNNAEVKLTVAGWGLTENEERLHSDEKHKTMVPIKSTSECAATYKSIQVELDGQLCTISDSPCTVDSGGPLVVHKRTTSGFNWYIAGIMSFGPTPCGNNNWPDVYTRVTDYIQWIVHHLKA